MYSRDKYLQKVLDVRDNTLVKIITGVRRSGKSSLLERFKQFLEDETPDQIVVLINFEDLEFEYLTDYRALHKYLKEIIVPDKRNYILIDEIQHVDQWEKAINSLRLQKNVDIYITGSNAFLLSSELATLLAGRYIEIHVFPLSFKEYCQFKGVQGKKREMLFQEYLAIGGFPGLFEMIDKPEIQRDYLGGIYNTIIMNDVISRNTVKDIQLLENIFRFLATNISCTVSTKSISDYLSSNGKKTTHETVDNYVKMLERAYIIYPIRRYDIKGKLQLKTQGKFYLVDLGLRNTLLGLQGQDIGRVLENVIYFELLRKGYLVLIGKIGEYEIDFIATKGEDVRYYQVTSSMLDETTRERELRGLKKINDNYRKIVLSLDTVRTDNFIGIEHQNIIDFLLAE